MAERVLNQDEHALRRRARRRLVGAVAIALTVIVVLPMLLDSEPKPLGPDVDIRIPAQDSPFDNTPPLAPAVTALPPPAPQPAEPTQAASLPDASSADRTDAVKPGSDGPEPVPSTPLRSAPIAGTGSASPPKSDAGTRARAEPKADRPDSKTDVRTDAGAKAKQDSKPVLKADTPFASQGYFLQLGAFANEANARQSHAKAIAAGFDATLLSSNGQYRVRVGPIPQHAQALEVQRRLKAKGFSPVLLGP